LLPVLRLFPDLTFPQEWGTIFLQFLNILKEGYYARYFCDRACVSGRKVY